jgi:hypothetical protein
MPCLGQAHQVAEWPGPLEGLHIQKPNGIERDMGGVWREVLFVAQIQELLTEFVLGELIRRSTIVESQLPHGGEVGFLGACGEATQLHVFKHVLA